MYAGKLWMWTVGYTVGDVAFITQTTADQQQASRVSKALWVVALASVLAYTAYQSYHCYESYSNPGWSAGVRFGSQLDFPAVLVCPVFQGHINYLRGFTCRIHNGTYDSGTDCMARAIQLAAGPFAERWCVEFNGNASDVAVAIPTRHDFLAAEVEIRPELFRRGRPPFAVALYPANRNASPPTPSSVQTDQPTVFVVTPQVVNWAALSQSEMVYLDGRPRKISFTASVSSATNSRGKSIEKDAVVQLAFSYSTFAIKQAQQVVDFDWLSLLCTVGGAATFACYLHEIAMLAYVKARQAWRRGCWCCCGLTQDEPNPNKEES